MGLNAMIRRHPWLVIAVRLLVFVLGYFAYLFQPHDHRNLDRLEGLANRCTPFGAPLADVNRCFRTAGIEFTELRKTNEEVPTLFRRTNEHHRA